MADSQPMPPSDKEAEHYYDGLPSRPRLVARSSQTPWERKDTTYRKQLFPVDDGRLASLWNQPRTPGTLKFDLINSLDGLEWSSIDLLRIGFPRRPDEGRPTVVLVTVRPGSTTGEDGVKFAVKAKLVLEEHGFDHVHCEIKESEVKRLSSGPPPPSLSSPSSPSSLATPSPAFSAPGSPPPTFHSTPPSPSAMTDKDPVAIPLQYIPSPGPRDIESQFSSSIGTSIAALDDEGNEGTKGLYLELHVKGKDEPMMVALTCRHVVFKEPSDNGEEYDNLDGRVDNERKIVQPGKKTLKSCAESLWSSDNELKSDMMRHENIFHKNKPLAEFDARKKGLAEFAKSEIERNKPQRREIRAMVDKFVPLWKDPAERVMGDVCFAGAKVVVSQDGFSWLRDWALIRLHQSSHRYPLSALQNMIHLGNHEDRERSWRLLWLKGLKVNPEDFKVLKRVVNPVMLHQVCPLAELENPHRLPLPRCDEGEDAMVVGKWGRTSGLTFGLVNMARSVVRKQLTKDGEQAVCDELSIVGFEQDEPVGGQSSLPYPGSDYFSRCGDSGSIVWCIDGRIAGLLTSGNGKEGKQDITYATPFELIIKDMHARGLDVRLPESMD
ncbi:hypothetical protein B0I35DRAFT_481871 [Stachybotrys elegans]|uniref:Uncharacterized protein n=1 Tax=Stachybotrys elegans TaxID=80388 RepID=A0A8K0SNC7_9HYPO|nr:hypothetical protein B0I35DRAFT_481871 [Stachybotrys elegans]